VAKDPNRMTRFTFVAEVAGSTIVEQFEAPTLREACEVWHQKSLARPEAFRASLFEYLDPTPIEDSLNVWCYGALDRQGQSILVNIVATSADPAPLGF
jgi:hypothetical protein